MKAVCNSEKLGKGEFSKSGQDSPLCREGGALVTQSCLTLATPWTVTCQAPLSVGFSRQEYWSELPFPSPRGSSQPRNRTQVSCTAGRFFAK